MERGIECLHFIFIENIPHCLVSPMGDTRCQGAERGRERVGSAWLEQHRITTNFELEIEDGRRHKVGR